MRQEHDGGPAALLFIRTEQAAVRRLDPEQREEP